MLEELQNLATLIATGVGVYVAVGGLNAWRRETTGKRDIELCQTVIEKFYEAEHKLSVLRSPMAYAHEGDTRKREAAETDEEAERRNVIFVPLARFNTQFEFWSEFLAYKFRMRALFGMQAAEAFDLVEKSIRQFRAVAMTRYQALYRDRRGLDANTAREFEKVIWEGLVEDDPLVKNVRDAIAKMEAICIPIVRSRSGQSWLARVWIDGLAGI